MQLVSRKRLPGKYLEEPGRTGEFLGNFMEAEWDSYTNLPLVGQLPVRDNTWPILKNDQNSR